MLHGLTAFFIFNDPGVVADTDQAVYNCGKMLNTSMPYEFVLFTICQNADSSVLISKFRFQVLHLKYQISDSTD